MAVNVRVLSALQVWRWHGAVHPKRDRLAFARLLAVLVRLLGELNSLAPIRVYSQRGIALAISFAALASVHRSGSVRPAQPPHRLFSTDAVAADFASRRRIVNPAMRQTAQPKPLTPEQVIGRLLETAGGQIIACNVVAGIQNGLVAPAWAADVLAWIGTLGSHEDYADPKRFLRALDDLKMRRHPTASSPSDLPDVRMRGVDAPVPFEVEVSCVLPAWMLRTLIFCDDKQRLRREGLALPRSPADRLAPAVAEEWQSKPAHTRTVRVNRTSTLGRHHSVVWFTRRTALADALAAVVPSARAQRTRDLLGLVQHQEGAMLAAMHFQPPTLSACSSARPTFADAGCHTRFKAWPDDDAARQERSWGCTVDLQALEESAVSLDGCPERIAKSIDGDSLSDGAAFEFELLGPVQAPAARGDAADAAFARRLLNARTVTELGAELKTLTGPH